MKPDEAIKPDAHLRAALRHAPDADAAAPADISAQIIAAAHRSAAERAAPPTRAPTTRGRWWLQPWGASGALATVLMAGVIGLMWRGEAPGPAREESVPQVAQAPLPVLVRVPSSTPAPPAADALATPPAPAPTPAPVTPPAAAKPRVLAAAPAVKPPTKPAAQSMAAEPSETVASARDAGAAITAAPPAPAPAALAAPAAPPPPPAAAANQRATQRAAQEQIAAAPAALSRLRAPAGAAQQPPWRTSPQPGDQFSWQPADRFLAPDAAWLARLAELSAGRWQPLSVTPTTAEVSQLQWQRSGATVARFGFDASSVWWCGPLTACERAPLDAATVRELLAQLAR